MSTIKLYDDQPYGKEFQAEVLSCDPVKKDGRDAFAVVLDQTLFFPEEGGQSPDTGKLGEAAVFYVSIDKNQVITHYTDRALETGSRVKGVIDWPQRFSNMQNHTGEHILSGLIHKYYGYNNVGFHLSPDIVTMDMDGVVSPEGLKKIEQEANRAVYENVEVICSYPEKEVLAALRQSELEKRQQEEPGTGQEEGAGSSHETGAPEGLPGKQGPEVPQEKGLTAGKEEAGNHEVDG